MNRVRSAIIAACLLLPLPAQAENMACEQPAMSISKCLDKGSRTLLSGVNLDTGERFQLKVPRNGFVTGRVGGREVRYWISPAERAALGASRLALATGLPRARADLLSR